MRIGKKLTLGYTAIVLMMVFVGTLYIYQNISMQAITQREIYNSFSILNSSWELMETIEHQQMAAVRYLFLGETLDENRANYHYEKARFINVYKKFHAEAGEHIKNWLEEFYQKILSYNLMIEDVFVKYEQGSEPTILLKEIKKAETIEADAHKILWELLSTFRMNM